LMLRKKLLLSLVVWMES